ncbi:MAG: heavy metal-binding domain-containing protein [Flavobacterium sp.]|uniref:heavy metal-binding domain-containing protein n=1 Tax=Flavobacterium sp. TaxID=239 RepID=UPI0026162447|nr:heavy metal-binding domain-containing protein [Flavobacterium sp.]MDD5151185.1 heavy metal-binding domain-containing protein [Flavobacterium sp.]
MKNIFFLAIVLAFVLVSCNQKNKQVETVGTPMMENDSTMMMNDSTMMQHDSTMMDNNSKMMHENSKVYSCPMHPEVHGKLDDKCPKCGMKLNVEVKNK